MSEEDQVRVRAAELMVSQEQRWEEEHAQIPSFMTVFGSAATGDNSYEYSKSAVAIYSLSFSILQ